MQIEKYSKRFDYIIKIGLAFAVTSNRKVNQFGNGDNGDLGVQLNAKFKILVLISGLKYRPDATYSEAMLISGASKQISCAIFYIFDLIIY